MKLNAITLQNFKSFGPQTPVIGKIEDLQLVNLIFGHNSSGKSNILKFLDLLFSPKVIRESILIEGEDNPRVRQVEGPFWNGSITNEPFIFHKNKRDIAIEFKVVLEISKAELQKSGFTYFKPFSENFFAKEKLINTEIQGKIISSGDVYTSTIQLTEVTINGKIIFSDTGSEKEYFQGVPGLEGENTAFENFMGIFNALIFFLDKDRYLVAEKEDSFAITLAPHNFKNWMHNLSLDAFNYIRYENFIKFVRKYGAAITVLKNFEPSFAKNPQGQIDIFINNGSERLPIGSFGTGIQQLLLLLAMLFDTNSKVILIEELELNLSPISQQALLQVFTNLIKDGEIDQVVFTSHSKTLAETPGISVYQVEISIDGISSIKSMNGKKSPFFKRDNSIDKQMGSVLRTPGIQGPEWGDEEG